MKLCIALALAVMAPAQSTEYTDPCRILKEPSSFTGRTVRIKALVEYTREDTSLVFPHCQGTMRTEEYEWKRGFCYGTSLDQPAPRTLIGTLDSLIEAVVAPLRSGSARLEIDASGSVITREKYSAVQMANGVYRTNGFCAFGRLPILFRANKVHAIWLREASTAP